MVASRQEPELSIYGSQFDQKSCFLILPILHYRNSHIISSPVGFSWVTHLNMRSESILSFVKLFCMLMRVSWVLKECSSVLMLCLSLSRFIKCHHPLVIVAPWQGVLLVTCHIPISHTWVWWETGPSLQPTLFKQAFVLPRVPYIITLALLRQLI